ncbi:MAG: VOC family protein [Planctomycetota bacterium]
MPNHVAHFAITADNPERAKTFYETVFGWTFEPWGPPQFWLINTGEGGIRGALQKRTEPATGGGLEGFECTIAVADVDATTKAIRDAGGDAPNEPFEIPTVGRVTMFRDTEGNRVGAMQYVEGVR